MVMRPASKLKKKTNHRTRVGHARSARTGSHILQSSLGVFADLGPDAPKIDDFVRAAGISRGTFYNHFQSVEELLAATSEWMTRDLLETIGSALTGIDGPVLRFGVGLRLFFAKASSDPTWSRFVARVWKVRGFDLPARDIERGVRLGVFNVPGTAVARDLIFGAVREALSKLGDDAMPANYGPQMAELCLQALGADRRSIQAAMKHELPSLKSRKAGQP